MFQCRVSGLSILAARKPANHSSCSSRSFIGGKYSIGIEDEQRKAAQPYPYQSVFLYFKFDSLGLFLLVSDGKICHYQFTKIRNLLKELSMTITSAYLVFLIFFFVFFFPMALGIGLYWYEKKSGMDKS